MASQLPPSSNLEVAESNSYVRGYHAYKEIWTPEVGEMLLLRCEPDNIKDKSAVAVMKETDIVGHVPYNISSMLSHFLSFVQVTGNCVNRGAGYGMEVPCTLLYGPQGYVRRIQELVQSLADAGHI